MCIYMVFIVRFRHQFFEVFCKKLIHVLFMSLHEYIFPNTIERNSEKDESHDE